MPCYPLQLELGQNVKWKNDWRNVPEVGLTQNVSVVNLHLARHYMVIGKLDDEGSWCPDLSMLPESDWFSPESFTML